MPNKVTRSIPLWVWFGLSGIIALLDQWTKYAVTQHFFPYQPYAVLPVLNITLAYNTGAAFSFLQDTGNWHRWFFVAISIGMSVFFVSWMLRNRNAPKVLLSAFCLLLGGSLGNLYDRWRFGFVVDFIDCHYHQYHFAIFNVADSAICVGAVILFVSWRYTLRT